MNVSTGRRQTGRRLSVSTWSLHRTLGSPPIYGPDTSQPAWTPPDGALPLLDLPAKLADFGIGTLEICHFSLPSTAPAYLADLRAALARAEVELWSLLIDGGDITHPEHGARDLAWIEDWLPVAEALGARNVRVVAGMQPPAPETIDRSVAALRRIIDAAEQHGVHVMTENWHALMDGPDVVTEILDRLQGDVGLCFDFGNWRGPDKYADLAAIAPYADSCHAKCAFDAAGTPDAADYARCLEIVDAAGFAGPYTLIYDGADADEWRGLAVEREMVAPFLLE